MILQNYYFTAYYTLNKIYFYIYPECWRRTVKNVISAVHCISGFLCIIYFRSFPWFLLFSCYCMNCMYCRTLVDWIVNDPYLSSILLTYIYYHISRSILYTVQWSPLTYIYTIIYLGVYCTLYSGPHFIIYLGVYCTLYSRPLLQICTFSYERIICVLHIRCIFAYIYKYYHA